MINKVLDRLEEVIITFCMALGTLLIFLAVLYRYTSGINFIWQYTQHLNFTWAQEACIFLMIWLAKFGACYGVRTHAHVGVDVLVRTLSPVWQRRFELFSHGAGAFFTGVVSYLGTKFVIFTYQMGQVSPDLLLPLWIPYLCVPLGSMLMCYRFLQQMYRTYISPLQETTNA